DLLAEAMLRLDDAGASIVLHVHDEIVAEISETQPPETTAAFEKMMAQCPTWAQGLPVAVAAWREKRYGK
ncbi:MAG: hypothetical protein V4641_03355, partial [Pseudomonadota bacterium]